MTGTLMTWLIGLTLTPLVLVGLLATFQATNRRLVLMCVVAALGLVALGQVFKPGAPNFVPGTAQPVGPTQVEEHLPPLVSAGLGGLGLLLVAVVVLVLARLWMSQLEAPDRGVAETRTIDRTAADPVGSRRRRSWSGRRRPEPRDAATAYIALIEDIRPVEAVRRGRAETPAAHARRLRLTGHAGLELQLLAADYALARFGARALSEREDRRAIGRWRRLRAALGPATLGARVAGLAQELVAPQEMIEPEHFEKRY
jgi:hypothetical protein